MVLTYFDKGQDHVSKTLGTEGWLGWSSTTFHLWHLATWQEKSQIASLQLHGFMDASYEAVVYLWMSDTFDHMQISLITAKTKVAPIKKLTIPRLELCGAYLLTQVLSHVKNVLEISLSNVYASTDSTIVLSWLVGNPRRFKTYVGNRVSISYHQKDGIMLRDLRIWQIVLPEVFFPQTRPCTVVEWTWLAPSRCFTMAKEFQYSFSKLLWWRAWTLFACLYKHFFTFTKYWRLLLIHSAQMCDIMDIPIHIQLTISQTSGRTNFWVLLDYTQSRSVLVPTCSTDSFFWRYWCYQVKMRSRQIKPTSPIVTIHWLLWSATCWWSTIVLTDDLFSETPILRNTLLSYITSIP